jgi:hypothetical protein
MKGGIKTKDKFKDLSIFSKLGGIDRKLICKAIKRGTQKYTNTKMTEYVDYDSEAAAELNKNL